MGKLFADAKKPKKRVGPKGGGVTSGGPPNSATFPASTLEPAVLPTAMSEPVASLRHTASATGGAMGNDRQGISYEHSRGTAWYGGVCFGYGSNS
jgi:hypothetical protein